MRLPLRRILFIRPFKPPNSSRPFTDNTLSLRARPQLPFLSSTNSRPPTARFLTTETKQWIRGEFWKAGKWTVWFWTFAGLSFLFAFGVQEEWLERKYPTPEEWSWNTRRHKRDTRWEEDLGAREENMMNWPMAGFIYLDVLRRLEDPKIDGAGLEEQDEGGILVAGIGRTGYDITKKSEPWRRGYYETLMAVARAAEHMHGWVQDTTRRNMPFPENVVIGPSNPNPRPLPPGAPPPPREEDCEPAFNGPEVYYMRALTTKGFTERQRMDAALAYASWLEYTKTPDAALEMYKWALDIATANSPPSIIDAKSGVLNPNAGTPSANILTASTALAVYHATNSNLKDALPIFLSILRARKRLPQAPLTTRSALEVEDADNSVLKSVSQFLKSVVVPPPYPPPPSDGRSPPSRDGKELCEEAAVMAYIGEIIYASNASKTSMEDGLAWTREAVDSAEQELRGEALDEEGRAICKQCLKVGLDNWKNMVLKLAKREKETKAIATNRSSWFGGTEKQVIGRWESEEHVVKDRIIRATEVLKPSKKSSGFRII